MLPHETRAAAMRSNLTFVKTGLAALITLLLATIPARNGESPIGKATSVVPAANYTRGTQVAALSLDDAVQQDDRVKTSGKGSTQIKFVDEIGRAHV